MPMMRLAEPRAETRCLGQVRFSYFRINNADIFCDLERMFINTSQRNRTIVTIAHVISESEFSTGRVSKKKLLN